MPNDCTIYCGGVSDTGRGADTAATLRLQMWGTNHNVDFKIGDVSEAMADNVPSVLLDLLDIAVYVYCADQAIARGTFAGRNEGQDWRRTFHFYIPVRNLELWQSAAAAELVATLSFLSEDEYHFHFEQLMTEPPLQGYFNFTDIPGKIDEVITFSGGLDSLAGAVQEAVVEQRRVLLVSHRSTQKLSKRHDDLLCLLKSHAGAAVPMQIPVRINKGQQLTKEYTQRSRSFLYAALGATVARMVELDRFRFYENGVVSLNLPASSQVIGARASRTTHPRVIKSLSRLLSCLTEKPFAVESRFQWTTKTEVVELIAQAGCADLIPFSNSCAHTWLITNEHPHCGHCSQCIDRRFAILAANQKDFDPAEGYGVDLLVGARDEQLHQTMLTTYVEMANRIEHMDAMQFFSAFGEASRALPFIDGNPEAVAAKIFDLYSRHARQVTKVVDEALAHYSPAIRRRELPGSCLVRLVSDTGMTVGDVFATTPGPSAVSDDQGSRNYIYRKGECWCIRFNGQEERIYTPEVGIELLQFLIEHPGKTYSAVELDAAVARQAKNQLHLASRGDFLTNEVSRQETFAADEIIDSEGRSNLQVRLAQVVELIEMTAASASPTRLDDIEVLQNELKAIESALNGAIDINGRPRKLGDERERVRKRVSAAIRRALKQFENYDAMLFQHLKEPVLKLGHTVSYTPSKTISWDTADQKSQKRDLLHEM